MSASTFLGMAQDLMHDPDAKAAFDADPDGFLAARGFEGLSPDDVSDGVGFVAETLPVESAMAIAGPSGAGEDLGLEHLASMESEGPMAPENMIDRSTDDDADVPDASSDDGDSGESGLPDVAFGSGHQWVDIADHLVSDDGDDGAPGASSEEDDAGIGVTWAPEDADDASPADPAFGHLIDDALDVDVDPTVAGDLATGAVSDPIGEALTWAYDEQGVGGPDGPEESLPAHGFEAEDVDDASPADHGGEPPDLGLHL